MEYAIRLSDQEMAELDAILDQEMVAAGLELPQARAAQVRSSLEHRAEMLKHLRKEIEKARNGGRAEA